MRLIAGLTGLNGPLLPFLDANPHAFTRADLVTWWSRRQLDAGLRSEAISRLLPGVYCGTRHARDGVVKGEALNLWAPRALVTGALAIDLYAGTTLASNHVDLVTGNGDTLHPPQWVRVHQIGRAPASGMPRSVRCTVPERAVLDAWRFAPPGSGEGLLYEALWRRTCTSTQIVREIARAPRVQGRRSLLRLLADFNDGATSPLEVRARREVFNGSRFREFEWQAELRIGRRVALADMLHRAAMLVVELDGERYHSTRDALASDRERDVDLAAAGFLTVRFGWADVTRRPQWCRERLLAILAARLPSAGSR
jgi:very-short-patch-repair endonuclease